ncbi:MAG TPA: hypothetical protein VHE33_20585, partial [Acidobacteriaceae bacterium]|nr:hypothetical protein [Acidobacteriaceae bacterium]
MLPPDGSNRGLDAALLPGGDTRRTGAVNEKFVTGCAKPPRQFWFALCSASFEVIQLATFVALEVMMMLFAGHFVARSIARQFNRLQPSLLNQRLDVSVHRGNSNARVELLRRSESFFRRQRPIGFRKSLSNGSLLSGVTNVSDAQSNLLCAD